MTKTNLPTYDKVFFVHYQCQHFDLGEQIFNMCVVHNNRTKQFDGEPCEATMIEQYCELVTSFCKQGLTPIHWNQNAKYYGIDHICNRYKALTGREIALEYPNEIDLPSILIDLLGDDYVPHPRLDSLAALNDIKGHSSEHESRTYPTQRVMLMAKVYHKLLNDKLKIGALPQTSDAKPIDSIITANDSKATGTAKPTKSFYDFLLHADKVALGNEIKKEFTTEKGKAIRILIESMKIMEPPMLSHGDREKNALYEAMKLFFCHNIGSYNGIFNYNYSEEYDATDVEAMKTRLRFVLEQLK